MSSEPTGDLQRVICAYIRAGAFFHIAAEAAGVSRELFNEWMDQGLKARAPDALRTFADAIRQAAAQARVRAEAIAFDEAPLIWLRHGPGKATPALPGWSASPRLPPIPADTEQLAKLQRNLETYTAAILNSLTPFPEARRAASEVMQQIDTDGPCSSSWSF